MVNKKFWMGILVLVFGMTVVGCDNGSTDNLKDTSLNGTWVSGSGENQKTLKLDNGNWETYTGDIPTPWMKGTFSKKDDNIYLKGNYLFGTGIGLEEKWYSKVEVQNNFDKTSVSSYAETFEESWLNTLFVEIGYKYSVDGGVLIWFWDEDNDATIYKKK